MTSDPVESPSVSIRTQFRQRVRELTNGRTALRVTDLTAEALSTLEDEEPGFTARFAAAMGDTLAHEETLREIATTRQRTLFETAPRTGSRTRLPLGERLMRRFEFHGDGHVVIGDMTRPMLRQSATIRKERATAELRVAAFEEGLADGMPDDRVTVRSHYDRRQIENLFERVTTGIDVDAVLGAMGPLALDEAQQ